MKAFLKHFVAFAMAVTIMFTGAFGVSASELNVEETTKEDSASDVNTLDKVLSNVSGEPIASMFDAAVKQDLAIDEEKHKFSNSQDGKFYLDYAKSEDYYVGSATDNSTEHTYCLIKYEDKFYLVFADAHKKYNGSYAETSFVKLKSKKYDSEKDKVTLNITNKKATYTTKLTSYVYDEDKSVKIYGFYEGLYYEEGELANDVVARNGHYDLFMNGKLISNDGWYEVEGMMVYVENTHVLYCFDNSNCHVYSGLKKSLVKNKDLEIGDVTYKFDKDGNLATGIYTIGGNIYYYEDGIMFTDGAKEVGKQYYYFLDDGHAVTNAWIKNKNITRFYGESGYSTKVYYSANYKGSKSDRLFVLKDGKWVGSSECVENVNGVFYLFADGGKRFTGSKWYYATKKVTYYVDKGVVTYKLLVCKKTSKAFFSEDGQWKVLKNTWLPIEKHAYMYAGSKGLIDAKFYDKKYSDKKLRQTYVKLSGGSWNKAKKTVLTLNGKSYYIGKKGKIEKKSGWKKLSDTSACYVAKSGKVYKYVYYDEKLGRSVYKIGYSLESGKAGIVSATIGKKTVYYYSDSQGNCTKNETITYKDYAYSFDKYGMTTDKMFVGKLNSEYDAWMSRVTRNLLGKTGIPCNVFVAMALQYAGGDNSSVKNAIKYTSYDEGGIVITSANNCSAWISTDVEADIVVSDGENWLDKKSYVINKKIVNFSYASLEPGDIINYKQGGDYEHVAIYFGKFDSAADVKAYLVSLGVSKELAEKSVRTWGAYYDNDSQYWCIHGGMGSSQEVYISNTCYEIPAGGSSEVADKIIKVLNK